jgi:hypothetical protein
MHSEEHNKIIHHLKDIKVTEIAKSMKEQWIDNSELLQLLKISRRTAQHYRDSNMLSYSIIGNKIFYKLSDVEDLLNRHYQKRLT